MKSYRRSFSFCFILYDYFWKKFFFNRILWQIKLSFSIRHSDSIGIQEMDFEIIFEVPFFWASAFIQLLLCSTNIFTGYRPLGIFCCFNSVIIFKPARWNNFLTNSSGLVTELSSSSISTSSPDVKFSLTTMTPLVSNPWTQRRKNSTKWSSVRWPRTHWHL